MTEVHCMDNNQEEILQALEELDVTEYLARKNKKNIVNIVKYTAAAGLTSLLLFIGVLPEMRIFAILFYCVIFFLAFLLLCTYGI